MRLLTLTGPGGVGKTRLALQVATSMLDAFADGVFFVPLASIDDPRLVMPTVAQAIGLAEADDRLLLDNLKAYLRDKQMLLVLDNFEQVLEAAATVSDLLAAAPRLKVLVTSRALSHLYGEYEYDVPPLELPDLKHLPHVGVLTRSPAVALFVARAQAAGSSFHLQPAVAAAVAEICVFVWMACRWRSS